MLLDSKLKIIGENHPESIIKGCGHRPYAVEAAKKIVDYEVKTIHNFKPQYVFIEAIFEDGANEKDYEYSHPEIMSAIKDVGAKIIYLDRFSDPMCVNGVKKNRKYQKDIDNLEYLKICLKNIGNCKDEFEKMTYKEFIEEYFAKTKHLFNYKKSENITEKEVDATLFFVQNILNETKKHYLSDMRVPYWGQEILNLYLIEPNARSLVICGGEHAKEDSPFISYLAELNPNVETIDDSEVNDAFSKFDKELEEIIDNALREIELIEICQRIDGKGVEL